MTTQTTSSIGSLMEIDQEEAALKAQLQQLARKKEEAKKAEGERAAQELRQQLPDARVRLLELIRMGKSLGISLDDEYTVTLRRIVNDAGDGGIALAMVQEILPDPVKLRDARKALGENGTNEITQIKAGEHLTDGKGRGIFFVWNNAERSAAKEAQPSPTDSSENEDASIESGDTASDEPHQEAEPPTPPPQPASKPVKKPSETK